MSIFTRNFPEEYWLLSPRAPYATIPYGYSWRAPAPRGSWPTVELFRPSVESLIQLLDRWADSNRLDSSSVDVIGFSQGAALSFTLGLLYPERFRKIAILAGFSPEGVEQYLVPGLFLKKNVFLAHGTQDDKVPISMARRTIKLLEDAGANVTYCESEVGHKLSAECLRALENYLAN
jgi:phospholipase/carboxylesterase